MKKKAEKVWRGEYSSVVGVPIMQGDKLIASITPTLDKKEALVTADILVNIMSGSVSDIAKNFIKLVDEYHAEERHPDCHLCQLAVRAKLLIT